MSNKSTTRLVNGPHEHYSWPILGMTLRVPMNVAAVLVLHTGQSKVFPQGDYYRLNLPVGPYNVYYVNCGRQSLSLEQVSAYSADSLEVSLDVEIMWQVVHPESVVATQHPLNVFKNAFIAGVKDCIQNLAHDELVGSSEQSSVSSNVIAASVKANILATRRCEGIAILDVLILNRQGDRRRTEIIQTASIETTRLENDRQVADAKEDLIIKEAEIARLAVEEEEKVRLQKAQIAAQVSKILKASELQAVEIRRLAEAPSQQHEEVLKSIEARAQAFSQLASTVIQSPMAGVQHGGNSDSLSILANALNAFVHDMPSVSAATPLMDTPPDAASEKPSPLRDRVAAELEELTRGHKANCELVEIIDSEEVKAVIWNQSIRISISCGPDYPQKAPRQITVGPMDPNSPQSPLIGFPWKEEMGLLGIVLEIYDRMMTPVPLKMGVHKNGQTAQAHDESVRGGYSYAN